MKADERVASAEFTKDAMSVTLMDGRTITVPLYWYPRLQDATEAQRQNWKIGGGGYGLHWPDVDEDLSTAGLLRGAPLPGGNGKSSLVSESRVGAAELVLWAAPPWLAL